MAAPSAVMRLVGMIFRRATLLPPKHTVRTAALVMTPVELTVGATQVLAALLGSLITPSSVVPTIPSKPRSRNEKSPAHSRLVGIVEVFDSIRRISFHSI